MHYVTPQIRKIYFTPTKYPPPQKKINKMIFMRYRQQKHCKKLALSAQQQASLVQWLFEVIALTLHIETIHIFLIISLWFLALYLLLSTHKFVPMAYHYIFPTFPQFALSHAGPVSAWAIASMTGSRLVMLQSWDYALCKHTAVIFKT